jgi:SNW domain-containing protein 1
VPVQLDSDGAIRYDVLMKQGREEKVVYSKHQDMLPLVERTLDNDSLISDTDFQKPTKEETQKTTDQTRAALEKILSDRAVVTNLKNVPQASSEPEYIHYTPAAKADGSSGGQSRVIKLVERPVDPLEPARFKHKRIPAGKFFFLSLSIYIYIYMHIFLNWDLKK